MLKVQKKTEYSLKHKEMFSKGYSLKQKEMFSKGYSLKHKEMFSKGYSLKHKEMFLKGYSLKLTVAVKLVSFISLGSGVDTWPGESSDPACWIILCLYIYIYLFIC